MESWFTLQSKRNKVKVSGEIRISVEYIGDPPEGNEKGSNPESSASSKDDRSSLFKTLIDEPFTVLQSNVVEWESLRIGPEEVTMEPFPSSSKISITNKLLLDNTRNYYAQEAAKGNVKVTAGKWYFEVKLLTSGRFYIGW